MTVAVPPMRPGRKHAVSFRSIKVLCGVGAPKDYRTSVVDACAIDRPRFLDVEAGHVHSSGTPQMHTTSTVLGRHLDNDVVDFAVDVPVFDAARPETNLFIEAPQVCSRTHSLFGPCDRAGR